MQLGVAIVVVAAMGCGGARHVEPAAGAAAVEIDLAGTEAAARGGVRGWDGARGIAEVRLVGWERWDDRDAAGELAWDVGRMTSLDRDWEGRARIEVEVSAAPGLRADVARATRARLFVQDAAGRRMMLPNREIRDPGWVRLGGTVSTALPQPCGWTEEGFDPRRVARVGINIEAGHRGGQVREGTLAVRGLRVAFAAPAEAPELPRDPAVRAGEGERAARMEARWRERFGGREWVAGVNLAWPAARAPAPDGRMVQLYAVWVEAREEWYGQRWDIRNPAVEQQLRDDFRGIRELFGEQALVRVMLFADGRTGLDGAAGEVTAAAADAVSRLLGIAREERVVLIPVLLDFGAAERQPETFRDPARRRALIAAFESLVRRHAGDPAVLAWEPMNEPENARALVNAEGWTDLVAFLSECTDAIHRAGELVTHGHRNPIDARMLRGTLATDLGQAHFYPRFETRPTPFDLGLRLDGAFGEIPAGWGEAPVRPGRVAEELVAARAAGARYVLFWDWRGDDETGDGFAVRAHAEEIRTALAGVRQEGVSFNPGPSRPP